MSDIILHITSRNEWTAAQQAGQYIAPSLSKEGFIHCSTRLQAVPVAEKFYNGQHGLVLLVVDPALLSSDLKWEPPFDGAPPPGAPAADLFPHIYGPINLSAVTKVVTFEPDADGSWTSSFMNPINIRPARPEDAPLAAQLFQLSMSSLADYLFNNDSSLAQNSLMKLFAHNAGRFSFKSTVVAEDNEGTVGFLVAYPGHDLSQLGLQTFPHLFPALGFVGGARFILRGIALPGGDEAKKDEYYISNLGVVPSSQGQGIGAHLLSYADDVAQRLNLKKCSLLVSLKNDGARRLYERNGYRIVETVQDKNEAPGYHRMVKELA